MSFAELEKAVRQLPPDELTALAKLVVQLDGARWDQQIEADAAAGRLDFLFQEADQERANGTLRRWPED